MDIKRKREISRKWYNKIKNDPIYREKQNVRRRKYYLSHIKEEKAQAIIRRHSRRLVGDLTKELVQILYEDNIKFFGTLTCVYCNNPIPFGRDTIDHRIPVSRGGLTVYSNLVICCEHCNKSKGTKTWNEFFWKEEEVSFAD